MQYVEDHKTNYRREKVLELELKFFLRSDRLFVSVLQLFKMTVGIRMDSELKLNFSLVNVVVSFDSYTAYFGCNARNT